MYLREAVQVAPLAHSWPDHVHTIQVNKWSHGNDFEKAGHGLSSSAGTMGVSQLHFVMSRAMQVIKSREMKVIMPRAMKVIMSRAMQVIMPRATQLDIAYTPIALD